MSPDLARFFDRSPAGAVRYGLVGRFRLLADAGPALTARFEIDQPDAQIDRVVIEASDDEAARLRSLLDERSLVRINVSWSDGTYYARAANVEVPA